MFPLPNLCHDPADHESTELACKELSASHLLRSRRKILPCIGVGKLCVSNSWNKKAPRPFQSTNKLVLS